MRNDYNNRPRPAMMGGGMMGGGMMGGGMMGGQGGAMQAQSLVQLVQESIDPDSWFDLSDTGEGTVTPYPTQQPKKLAIYNTHEVHEEVEKLRSSAPSQAEVERVRTDILSGVVRGLQRIGGFAEEFSS